MEKGSQTPSLKICDIARALEGPNLPATISQAFLGDSKRVPVPQCRKFRLGFHLVFLIYHTFPKYQHARLWNFPPLIWTKTWVKTRHWLFYLFCAIQQIGEFRQTCIIIKSLGSIGIYLVAMHANDRNSFGSAKCVEVGVGWHVPESAKGVANCLETRPSRTQGRATRCESKSVFQHVWRRAVPFSRRPQAWTYNASQVGLLRICDLPLLAMILTLVPFEDGQMSA